MIKILLGLVGVTGVGKSYYKDLLTNELGFKKIKIITTREMRKGEKNNIDKIFVTKDELQEMVNKGEIAYQFDLLGVTYAYTKEELFSARNTVFEMHYPCVFDFKRICPDIKTIYLLPKDLEIPKQKLKERNLKPEVEKARIQEIDEHYNRFMTDEKLRNMFDFCLYNEYNEKTDDEVINLVKKLLSEDKAMNL